MNKVFAAFWYSSILPLLSCTTTTTTTTFDNHESLSRPQSAKKAKKAGMKAKQQQQQNQSFEKELQEMQEKLQQLRIEKEQTEELLKAREETLKMKEEELEERRKEREKLQTVLKKLQKMKEFKPTMDVQSQGVGSSIGPIYSYSSVHGGVNGESAQRCKARLERHRRTAERAAKALAEKNMRDLLAQREQAERNRLAEALDAEVKRWSSGKEANLCALLSTLQYILGPNSGWQRIPLAEVITSVAVKKAYKKATLCVHPNKLQQRGASVQQKYICEKVFDLLKEAWNRFNSEEQ